jgi:enoyl-CoA hydratase
LKENGIGVLSLNRPEKLNAINFQMEQELHEVLDHLMINLDCRVLILRAEGRAFCAGTDLQEGLILHQKKFPEGYEKYYFVEVPEPIKKKMYHQWRISSIFVKMRKISQPIIALVQGAAAGAGADVGGSYFLPRLIGSARASEIMYTGRSVGAEEAVKIGLALKSVEIKSLMDSALELANELLKKSPLGLRMTKQALNLTLDSPSLETICQLENSSIVLTFSSKDVNEASAAFFSKRNPKYPLR